MLLYTPCWFSAFWEHCWACCLLSLPRFLRSRKPSAGTYKRRPSGANCGGCGYAGCSAFAERSLTAPLQPTAVWSGRRMRARNCGNPWVELTRNTRLAAFVKCSGGNNAAKRYSYKGINDCHAAMQLAGGPTVCQYGCLALKLRKGMPV